MMERVQFASVRFTTYMRVMVTYVMPAVALFLTLLIGSIHGSTSAFIVVLFLAVWCPVVFYLPYRNLVSSVEFDGKALWLRIDGDEIRIPLENIQTIKRRMWQVDSPVMITLLNPSPKVGRRFGFMLTRETFGVPRVPTELSELMERFK